MDPSAPLLAPPVLAGVGPGETRLVCRQPLRCADRPVFTYPPGCWPLRLNLSTPLSRVARPALLVIINFKLALPPLRGAHRIAYRGYTQTA
jgi:hypothetical protein